jgi:hypothetical protein
MVVIVFMAVGGQCGGRWGRHVFVNVFEALVQASDGAHAGADPVGHSEETVIGKSKSDDHHDQIARLQAMRRPHVHQHATWRHNDDVTL